MMPGVGTLATGIGTMTFVGRATGNGVGAGWLGWLDGACCCGCGVFVGVSTGHSGHGTGETTSVAVGIIVAVAAIVGTLVTVTTGVLGTVVALGTPVETTVGMVVGAMVGGTLVAVVGTLVAVAGTLVAVGCGTAVLVLLIAVRVADHAVPTGRADALTTSMSTRDTRKMVATYGSPDFISSPAHSVR